MIVLPGPASKDLATRLALELEARLIPVFFKKFPDGESYLRIDGDIRGEDTVIVQTTCPPQDERLMQLFLLASAAECHGAERITAVVPYLAYSRQDKVFLPGEALSIKVVVDMLKTCGARRLITLNAHNPAVLRTLTVPVDDISAIPLLAKHFRDRGLRGAVSLSMGKEGASMAEQAAGVLEGPCDYLPTQRNRQTGEVTIESKPLDVNGKVGIFFDDIISSGGTVMKGVAHAKKLGAARIYVACVHPLLMGDAEANIMKSGADGLVGTDSVPSPVSIVSVAPAIAEALRKWKA